MQREKEEFKVIIPNYRANSDIKIFVNRIILRMFVTRTIYNTGPRLNSINQYNEMFRNILNLPFKDRIIIINAIDEIDERREEITQKYNDVIKKHDELTKKHQELERNYKNTVSSCIDKNKFDDLNKKYANLQDICKSNESECTLVSHLAINIKDTLEKIKQILEKITTPHNVPSHLVSTLVAAFSVLAKQIQLGTFGTTEEWKKIVDDVRIGVIRGLGGNVHGETESETLQLHRRASNTVRGKKQILPPISTSTSGQNQPTQQSEQLPPIQTPTPQLEQLSSSQSEQEQLAQLAQIGDISFPQICANSKGSETVCLVMNKMFDDLGKLPFDRIPVGLNRAILTAIDQMNYNLNRDKLPLKSESGNSGWGEGYKHIDIDPIILGTAHQLADAEIRFELTAPITTDPEQTKKLIENSKEILIKNGITQSQCEENNPECLLGNKLVDLANSESTYMRSGGLGFWGSVMNGLMLSGAHRELVPEYQQQQLLTGSNQQQILFRNQSGGQYMKNRKSRNNYIGNKYAYFSLNQQK